MNHCTICGTFYAEEVLYRTDLKPIGICDILMVGSLGIDIFVYKHK